MQLPCYMIYGTSYRPVYFTLACKRKHIVHGVNRIMLLQLSPNFSFKGLGNHTAENSCMFSWFTGNEIWLCKIFFRKSKDCDTAALAWCQQLQLDVQSLQPNMLVYWSTAKLQLLNCLIKTKHNFPVISSQKRKLFVGGWSANRIVAFAHNVHVFCNLSFTQWLSRKRRKSLQGLKIIVKIHFAL